jgi:predicted transcriptional regulator
MSILWVEGPRTIKQVHCIITPRRDSAYTTVQTTMNRLTEKGLLRRAGNRRGSRYTVEAGACAAGSAAIQPGAVEEEMEGRVACALPLRLVA